DADGGTRPAALDFSQAPVYRVFAEPLPATNIEGWHRAGSRTDPSAARGTQPKRRVALRRQSPANSRRQSPNGTCPTRQLRSGEEQLRIRTTRNRTAGEQDPFARGTGREPSRTRLHFQPDR